MGEEGSPWTYRCEVSPPQTWHVHSSRAWMCLRMYSGKAVRLLPCALSLARERDLSFALLQSMLQNAAPGPAGGDPHQPHMFSGSMVSSPSGRRPDEIAEALLDLVGLVAQEASAVTYQDPLSLLELVALVGYWPSSATPQGSLEISRPSGALGLVVALRPL